jgi:hypothetical protein
LLLPVSFAASFKVKLWLFSMVFSIGSHYWFYSIHYNITYIKEKADSLEDDRNHWRKQAKTVTLLLETDRKKPGIFDLFSKK